MKQVGLHHILFSGFHLGFEFLLLKLLSSHNMLLFVLHLLTIFTCYRCIPFRYKDNNGNCDGERKKEVEVLMINSASGPGLLFPKVKFRL
jgi:hypothetical protein